MKSSTLTFANIASRRERLTARWLAGRITTREFHQRLFLLCRHLAVPAGARKA